MGTERDIRRQKLQRELTKSPFLTDEQMADMLNVSVATIRLDRAALGIPELRIRMRSAVKKGMERRHRDEHLSGELLELVPQQSAISLVETTTDMTDATGLIPAQLLYGIANELAVKVLGLPVAVCGVGNIKYKEPVRPGERLMFKLRVVRKRGREYYVWVKAICDCEEVFRTKFIMKSYTEVNE